MKIRKIVAIALLMCGLSAPAFAQAPGICSGTIISVPTGGGVFAGSTSGVSAQHGRCAYTKAAPESIYEWTPSSSGTATVKTCGGITNFNTAIYVRERFCRVGEQVACNDDACANANGDERASEVEFTVDSGTTYYIFVDGVRRSKGLFTLTIIPPGGIVTTTSSTTSTSSTTTTSTSSSTSTSTSTSTTSTSTSTSTSTTT